jgi:hypothetical protein
MDRCDVDVAEKRSHGSRKWSTMPLWRYQPFSSRGASHVTPERAGVFARNEAGEREN